MSKPPVVRDERILEQFRRVRPPQGARWREGWRTLAHQVVRHEGVVLEAYRDSLGFLTIGCGHLVKEDEREIYAEGKTHSANWLAGVFADDLAEHLALGIEWVGEDCWKRLPDAIRLLVGGLGFNLGGKLGDWDNTAGLIENGARTGSWKRLATALEGYKWAGQVGDRSHRLIGLVWVADLGIDVKLRRG